MAIKAVPEAGSPEPALPDSGQRPCQISGQLLDRLDGSESVEASIGRCASLLARHLAHLADWSAGSWRVGDSNRYSVTTTVEDGLEVVLTLSSEPLEDVHWRLSTTGPTAAFDRGRREQLQRYGFSPAGEGGGWERELRIGSPRDAANAARDLLALLADVFSFRGQEPMTFTLAQAQRAEPGLLYRVLGPEDLRKLLHGWGYRAELTTTASGTPVIRSGAGGYKFHILFTWPTPNNRLYGCLNFVTIFPGRQDLTLVMVNDVVRTSRFGRLYLDNDGDLILERDVSLTGGVSTAFIHECLLDWAAMMESVAKKLDKLATPPMVMH